MTANGAGTRRVNDAQPCRICARMTWLWRVSPLILVLFAFGLYMWRIDAKGIWWDESLSLYRARQTVPYILSNRIDFPGSSTIDQHPPLYFLLLHGLTRLCGESDLVLRFPSVLFAVLIVPLLYALGTRVRDRGAGLVAALFGALSPFYLWYAQEARMYTMVTALGLASIWFLWRGLTEEKWTWGLASGLFACLAMGTQYLFAPVILSELLLGFFLWPRRSTLTASDGQTEHRRRLWLALGCAALVLLLALAVAGRRVAELVPSLGWGRRYVPPQVMIFDALNSFSLGLSVSLHKVWWLDLFFAGIFVVGVISIWRRPPGVGLETTPASIGHRRGAGLVLLLGCIFVPMVSIWVFSLFVPVYANSRYLIMSSPAFYLGMSLGVDAAAQWKRGLAFVLAVVVVASMGVSRHNYFVHKRYQAKEDYRGAAQFIMENERIRDAVIVSGPESMTAFMHYYRGGRPVTAMPKSGPDPNEIAEALADLAKSYDRLWLVHGRSLLTDPENLVEEWIGTHTMFLQQRTLPGYAAHITVSAHLPRYPVWKTDEGKAPPEAIGSFGDSLSLLRYAVRYGSVSGEATEIAYPQAIQTQEPALSHEGVAPGSTVSVVFIWQPLREMDIYKTSLRLVDEQGLLWAQRDREPFMYLPTSDWPIGARIRHEADLRIPPGTPPGVFRLRLWVYEKATQRPLSFKETNERRDDLWLELGQVVVAPAQHDWPDRAFLPERVDRPRPTAVFGGYLELMGHVVAPHTLQAGEALDLQLYWRARRAIDQDCDLVLNWVDATGKVWHTSTHSPSGIDYPTSRWQKGEMVRGLLRLPIPLDAPRGLHRLHLLVHARDGQRFLWLSRGWLPWSGHDLEIATVTIE